MLPKGYNVRTAAQVAAFFAMKEGGEIDVLKVTKLIYFADKEFLNRYNRPILYDNFVSMPLGPVNSTTYNYLDGRGKIEKNQWDAFVTGRSGDHKIGLRNKNLTLQDLNYLSIAEERVLEYIYEKFGQKTSLELVDYAHDPKNCPEWEDPDGSSAPIPYERIFRCLGRENGEMLAEAVKDERFLSGLLA